MTPEPPSVSDSVANVARARMDGSAPRVALRWPAEVAQALGASPDFVEEHLRGELKLVRLGRLVFCAVSELEAYLEQAGSRLRDEVTA